MENKSLIEIANDANKIETMLLESDGEMTPEIEAMLDVNQDQMETKVDGYHIIQERLLSAASMYKELAKKYAQAAKFLENAESRLVERIKYAMHTMGVDTVNGSTIRFQLKPTSGTLVIDNEELIPVEFKSEKLVTEINKKALKEQAAKEEVPGAHIEPGLSLRKTVSKKIGAKDE